MSKSKASARVLTQVDDYGNVTVTLNRPEVHNAFDPEMVAALTDVLEAIAQDDSIRAVVIAGAGKSFCAGADIAHMRKSATFTKAQNYRNAGNLAQQSYGTDDYLAQGWSQLYGGQISGMVRPASLNRLRLSVI